MKKDEASKTLARTRLRTDGEEFDATPLGSGTFLVDEVALTGVCTHGDVVRADEDGRVSAIVAKWFSTEVSRERCQDEAQKLAACFIAEGHAARAVGRHVLHAQPVEGGMRMPWADGEHDDREMRHAWRLLEAEHGDLLAHHDEVWHYAGSRLERGWRNLFYHSVERGTTVDGLHSYPATKGWSPSGRLRRARLTRGVYERREGAWRPHDHDGLERDRLDELDAARIERWVRGVYGEEAAHRESAAWDPCLWSRPLVREWLDATASLEPLVEEYPSPLRLSALDL